jgi:hypothetical protein
MAKAFLDTHFWKEGFAVTDGDLNRLEEVLHETNKPVWATQLLRCVIERKLERTTPALDPLERARSAQAASRFLGEATLYHPTKHYELGQFVYVARKPLGKWQIGCGQVVEIDRSDHPPAIVIEVPGELQPWKFLCEVPPSHKWALSHSSPLSSGKQNPEEVLDAFSGDLLPHLLGRLAEDPRFVNWGDQWWLLEAIRRVSNRRLDQIQTILIQAVEPVPTNVLLSHLDDEWPDTPGNRFSLNRMLLALPDRFKNVGTETEPSWQALLPSHMIRFADGMLLDMSLDPDELWAEHGALFSRPLPDELRGRADVVELYEQWFLRSLLISLDSEDLEILHTYLEEACEARSDSDLLGLFGMSPQDDDWLRWRFSLAWALHESGDELGIEFVGAGDAWRWALHVAPVERPARHRPIPGKDGLPVQVVEVSADEIERELDEVEPDEPEPEPEPWEPTASEWRYTLTYYDWQHGILPYTGNARAIIPPLVEGQARALLYVVAPQVSEDPFAVTLHRHERTPWLQSAGLQELCQGFHLVPGARIRLLRTEQPDRFTLLYTPAPEQTRRVLMFEAGSLRPRILEITFACEVNEDMLLAEGRFTDLDALDRLYRADRRTAPKVLADVFEAIGEYDAAERVYRAAFRDLFLLLCVTKPYSLSYVRQILSHTQNYPWFCPDEEPGGDCYVYDLNVAGKRVVPVPPEPKAEIPDLGALDKSLDESLHHLESDPSQARLLVDAMAHYRQLPGQAQMLVLRDHAHGRIRGLLSQDALPNLTLEDFNQRVWQFGRFEIDGHPVDWTDWITPRELLDCPPDQLRADLADGRVIVQGNATWGSGAHLYGTRLAGSDSEKLTILKETLETLLYGPEPVEERIAAADRASNGFGLNIITGILHAMWPDRYSLFNSAVVKGMGLLLPEISWKRDVRHYPRYQQVCKWLMGQETLGFDSLTDLDWFIYNVSKGHIPLERFAVAIGSEPASRDPDAVVELDEPARVSDQEQAESTSRGDRSQPVEGEFRQMKALIQSSLVGRKICTLTGSPNHITETTDEGLIVTTESGTDIVPWQWIDEVYQVLCQLGTVERKTIKEGPHRTQGVFRSSFIFGLLALFTHVEAQTEPRIALVYKEPSGEIQLREVGEALTSEAEPEEASVEPDEAMTQAGDTASPPAVESGDEYSDATPPLPEEVVSELEFTETLAPTSPDEEPTSPSEEAHAPPPPSQRTQAPSRTRAGTDLSRAKTLFSNHYLETRLPDHPEWAEDPTSTFDAVRALWQRARAYGDKWNEAQTEEEFVKPVLDALGWAYIVQPKAGSRGRVTRPDYALFAGKWSKNEAQPFLRRDDPFYSRALAIAEAKYWGRPLSQKDATGRNTWKRGSNPSHQMVSYLVGTRVPWGILTNGRAWRLYSREVSSTASEFYEVDLGLIFDSLPDDAAPSPEQLDQFRRWWLFFRRDAFIPDARDKTFIQRVHKGSGAYAREISDKLKELVFQQVVPEIAGEFVAFRVQQLGIQEETEETLKEVYAATLSLLYKLLFLLYAEARGLLPVDNPGYREQSLTALAGWAAERIDKELPLSEAVHATAQYDRLLALFHRVDQGDPSLGVPRYNGGLFNPGTPENRFLEAHKLSDRTVARAVDILVRDAGQPVDYAYISVRNLGAIYEGLLENRLTVSRLPKSRKTSEVLVELVNDKGERKASGSYYTPDYIVEYIVQHTLAPVLDERQAQFEAAMDRCAELRRQLQHTDDTATVRLLRAQLEQAERDAREAFLGVKVCDPAMGSGHFLVNAVDHLTDGIIQRMQDYHDGHPEVLWEWNPIQALIEAVRGQVLVEMMEQGIALDPEQLDDTALLTRLVMKRCIYGVDLNPLAVELAKLSLWLHSFTVGAPLSFLDHHLRWGNSLIGSDVRSVEGAIKATETGQFALFRGPFAGLLDLTALMTEVAGQADATLADVRRSAEVFAQFQKELTPYKQALDLWVSQYFGNKHAREFLTLYGDNVLPALKGSEAVAPQYRAAIDQARELWQEKRFFHWDLEFPEVFVDLRKRDWEENPGFDAVIGNPPWLGVRTGEFDPDLLHWMRDQYVAAVGQFDLAAIFLELGNRLTDKRGFLGFVVPKRIASNESYADLRKLVTIEQPLSCAIDLGVAFEGVNSDALILASSLAAPDLILLGSRQGKSDIQTWRIRRAILAKMPFHIIPINSLASAVDLIDRISSVPTVALGDIASIARGAECGMNHPAIHREPAGEGLPLVDHLDVSRYTVHHSGWRIDPTRIRASKLKPISLYEKIPKLLVRFLSARLIVGKDDVGYASTNLVYHLHLQETTHFSMGFLCATLCSRLLSFWYRTAFQTEEVKFPHVQKSHLISIPIRHIDFTSSAAQRQRYTGTAQHLYDQFCTNDDETRVRAFVRQHLDTERTDIIHDLLAYLAEQMIQMHREKQEHQRSFRFDLAGYMDEGQMGKLNRLYTPKKPPAEGIKNHERRLAAYEEAIQLARAQLGPLAGETLNLEDFWRLNQGQWMWVLRQRLGKVANMSDLVAVYERYRQQLAPLMRTIQRTDWLIDQVVYQLYGLTEEEIKIVEGK